MLSVLALSACEAKTLDGTYQRIESSIFEQQNGMSQSAIVSENGGNIALVNNWGNAALTLEKSGKETYVLQNGQKSFSVSFVDNMLTLTDVDNPEMIYKFKKGENK